MSSLPLRPCVTLDRSVPSLSLNNLISKRGLNKMISMAPPDPNTQAFFLDTKIHTVCLVHGHTNHHTGKRGLKPSLQIGNATGISENGVRGQGFWGSQKRKLSCTLMAKFHLYF